MIEEWKAVVDFENNYEVSNLGNIRTKSRISKTNWGKWKGLEVGLRKMNPGDIKNTGYLQIILVKDGKKYTRLVHRLVAEAFIPIISGKKQVNHKNGDKTDNRTTNLEWMTAKENVQHAVLNGLRGNVKGTKNPMSRLTEATVLEIYNDNSGLSYTKLGEKYKISRITAFDIKNGRRWSSLTKHPYLAY